MDIMINTERTDEHTLAVKHDGTTVGWVHAVPGGLNKYMGQRRQPWNGTRIFETEGEAVQWVYAPHAEPPRNAFMEILSAVPDDEPDTSFDQPTDEDVITDHATHNLRYVERGTEHRHVEINDDGSITIGKSTDWDCDISDIECLTCGRMLNLADREWDFTA